MTKQDVADVGAGIVIADEKAFAFQLGPVNDGLFR